MIGRRHFMAGLLAGVTASIAPDFAQANRVSGGRGAPSSGDDRADLAHPLERLQDVATGQGFRLDGERYNLVMIVTAQESYPNCGGMFIGMHQLMAEPQSQSTIHPIIVMPRVSDQVAGQADLRNLARAQNVGFPVTILSGALEDIQAVVESLDGAFLEYDNAGLVNGHTQNGFFMTPAGKLLMSHPIEDYYTFSPLVSRLRRNCESLFNPFCR